MKMSVVALGALTCAASTGCVVISSTEIWEPGHIHYLDPDGMHHNPALQSSTSPGWPIRTSSWRWRPSR